MRRPAPVEAKQFRSESAKELVAITYELQRLAKRGTFFLDQATAGDLVGLGQQQVSVWMKEFVARGILERVSTGRPRHACRYRFLGNGAASVSGRSRDIPPSTRRGG